MTTNEKIRCAAYIRVSTDEQVNKGGSLGGQKEAILALIKSKENQIIDIKRHIYIDDGKSGASDKRPAFNKMMKAAENNDFDILYVYSIDRLYRKTLGVLETVEKLDKYGIKFKSITQDIDTSSSFGKVILQMMASIAELERNLIRERTIMGKMSKVNEGYFVGGGHPSLGYDYYKDGRGTKEKINEEEAKLVRKIFNLYTKEKKTLGQIKSILELDGEKTKSDIVYNGKEKNNKAINGMWHVSTITRILQREMYIGYYYYGKTEKINGKVSYTTEDKWIKFECAAILEDKSQFYTAKELLEKNKLNKNNHNPHTFAGLIKCGICNKNYVGSFAKSKGKKYANYKCKGSIKSNEIEDHRCINTSVSEIELIKKCWVKIEEAFSNPKDFLESYYNEKKENNKIEEYEEELETFEKKIENTNSGIQSLYEEMYLSNSENDKDNKKKVIDRLNTKVTGYIKQKIEIEENIDRLKKDDKNKGNFYDVVKLYEKKYKNLNDKTKIELIQLLVGKIIIHKGKRMTVHYKFENKNPTDKNQGQKKMVIKKNGVSFSTILRNKEKTPLIRCFFVLIF